MQKQPFPVGGGRVKRLRTGGERGRGVKNFRTRAVRDLGGLILLGEGQYPITCHGFFK